MRTGRPPVDPKVRFYNKVEKTKSCWLGTAAKTNTGYGRFFIRGVANLAHRASYYLEHGYLDPDLTIDHLCGNKLCVNPAHLELVDLVENQDRYWGPKTHCENGHEYTSANTRTVGRKRYCRACSRETMRRHRKRAKV